MKKITLLLCATFLTFNLFSQTNGWHQYAQPRKIYDLQYDSAGNLHCGTDIGYIKFDISLNVVDYKNLTSQEFPVGALQQIAINPNDNNFIYAITDNKNILEINVSNNEVKYPVFNETLEDYTDGDFVSSKIYWAKSGILYVFGTSNKHYQTLENGVLSDKKELEFYPRSIVENNDGTKAYFASTTKGLWELDKTNNTWTNYTKQNSTIVSDGLTDLATDKNDVLYIASYGGLCTLENGVFTSYLNPTVNQTCFQVDVHPTKNEVLVNRSEANAPTQQGFAIVKLETNTWTLYQEDDTHCVNDNTFDFVKYTSDGAKIITIESYGDYVPSPKLIFDPVTDTCTPINFNYLNAENINSYSDFNVRLGKTAGTLDIGFTTNKGFNILNVVIQSHQQQYANLTLPIPNPANTNQYGVLSHKDYFLVTNNQKEMQFVDKDNLVTKHQSFNNGSLIKTKKGGFSKTDKVPLIYSEFVGSDRKLFLSECDISTNSCSLGTELFANDRILTSHVTFSCQETSDTELICGVIKKNTNNKTAIEVSKIDRKTATPIETILLNLEIQRHVTAITKDILFLDDTRGDGINNPQAHFLDDSNKKLIRVRNGNNGIEETVYTSDKDGDGYVESWEEQDDSFLSDEAYDDAGEFFKSIVALFRVFEDVGHNGNINREVRKQFSLYLAHEDGTIGGGRINKSMTDVDLPGVIITNSEFDNLPNDLKVYKLINVGYELKKQAIFMLTNYGLLFKFAINYSNVLSIEDNTLLESKVLVYPNPSTNSIKVSGAAIKQLTLFDLFGRKIMSSNSNELKFPNISKGIYLVIVKTKNNVTITKKIIVQ